MSFPEEILTTVPFAQHAHALARRLLLMTFKLFSYIRMAATTSLLVALEPLHLSCCMRKNSWITKFTAEQVVAHC